jgi:hypothetical protein
MAMETKHHIWLAIGVLVVVFIAYEWYTNNAGMNNTTA